MMRKDGVFQLGTKALDVFVSFGGDELKVGRLVLAERKIHFKYDESFLKHELNLSPIKLGFNNQIQVANPTPFNGLFGLFDDSLPDGWGMLLLTRRLEKVGLSIQEMTILDQLAMIGDQGRGALIYRPAIELDSSSSTLLNLDDLSDEIDEVSRGMSAEMVEKLFALGGSSGGARPKVNVGFNEVSNEIMHDGRGLPSGFEHWMIKFPSSTDPVDSAHIEFAYAQMAKLAGIAMSDCRLIEGTSGRSFFGTKRFDREGDRRVHMHSMAGLVHDDFRRSTIDYGHIIDTAFILEKSAEAREKALRLAAFNVYSHNRDDHSKNFSWLMNEAGDWSMSPAYDLTFSATAINEHSTRVDGEGARPGRKQLLSLAEMFSISTASAVLEQVQDAIAQWPKLAEEAGVSTTSRQRIQKKLLAIRD